MSIHKYIRHKRIGFIVWPEHDAISHSQMARAVGFENIISAGFAAISAEDVECYGFSYSTDLGVLEGDSELLAEQLGVKKSR